MKILDSAFVLFIDNLDHQRLDRFRCVFRSYFYCDVWVHGISSPHFLNSG
jgi:hypothetical protein